ncbi:cupin domain-containing protein [Pedosphaera parvula]|uniref:Cupin 2 conserved barrel domain protein n=1 Tax=Pedosphaera parvula (strain Ellin514) TaxID=320771 RepID=B9XET1_PEDPL|nr:cupin domain-containing protein [Pedosphaera parvula]EEF61795.1 Cupin 2 conserved barrel domain protein [Pedosphaera parvula Ellin514]
MISKDHDRILDFAPIGMWWEITQSTADSDGRFFEAINVLVPGFAGPPLHIHPHAEESYQVLSGTLDVCVAGQWRELKPGESITVPAGTPHTLKNAHTEEVRLLNVHKPALGFERFFRRFHALVSAGRLKLPPKDFGSLVLVSMLFVDHEQEIKSAKPPHNMMRVLAFIGRLMGYKLPQ